MMSQALTRDTIELGLLTPVRDLMYVADTERLRPPQSEVMALICDSTRARERLGWAPRYALEQGLEATVAYMREHLHDYKSDRFNR